MSAHANAFCLDLPKDNSELLEFIERECEKWLEGIQKELLKKRIVKFGVHFERHFNKRQQRKHDYAVLQRLY